MTTPKSTYYFKYFLGFLTVLLLRLIPFRPANFEPIMATAMPFSKKMSKGGIFIFSFLSIAIYDLFTNFGIWSLTVGIVYGLVGVGASYYFERHSSNKVNYLRYAILGTLVFDCITGLMIGPILFHQSFSLAFLGQIPFTVRHLIGNGLLAYYFSPVVESWLVTNKSLEDQFILSKLKAATL